MFIPRLNVNEALARLENHIQHISSADIYTEPPCDSGSISEEDSDDEDQPSDLTHLSGKQLDASAELVLHQPINANSIDNDETEIRITEPLPKKNKNYHKKPIRQWTSDDLISEPPQSADPPKYFEKQWSPADVFDHLKQSNIGATRTIRVNRTGETPLLDPSCMEKKARSTYCHAKEKDSGCILVRWNDNSVVTLASTCYGVNPVRSASRWSNSEKKRIFIKSAGCGISI